jgi:photosystem II stability/assembly factor-like uncharacterized protein
MSTNPPDDQTVFRTTDGGNSWDSVSSFQASVRDLQFLSPSNGWYLNYEEETVYRSQDGGITWEICLEPPQPGFISSLFFLNEETGWVGGKKEDSGIIYKTNDAGDNWTEITMGVDHPSDVFFLDMNYGWAVSDNYVARTTDGGNTWEYSQVAGAIYLQEPHFLNDQFGWMYERNYFDETSQLYYSNDGGITWYEDYCLPTHGYDMNFDPQGNGWLVGAYGAVLNWNQENLISSNHEFSLSSVKYHMNAYPNPFDGEINFEIEMEQTKGIFQVFDMNGQIVHSQEIYQESEVLKKFTWDPEDLIPGLYIARLQNGIISTSIKIIKKP